MARLSFRRSTFRRRFPRLAAWKARRKGSRGKAVRKARLSRTLRTRTPLGMPSKFITRLRYFQEVEVDAGALSAAYIFRANDLYDPNYTSTGHQPRGFDQLCQFYTRFYVIGSKITVKRMIPQSLLNAVNPGTATNEPCYWGVDIGRTPTELTGLESTDLMERVKNRFHLSGFVFNDRAGRDSQTRRFSTKKHWRTKSIIGNSDFACTDSNSVFNNAFYLIWVASHYGNNPSTMYFAVSIEYTVVCTLEKDDVAQS